MKDFIQHMHEDTMKGLCEGTSAQAEPEKVRVKRKRFPNGNKNLET